MDGPKDDPPCDDRHDDYDPDGDIDRYLNDPSDYCPEPLPPATLASDFVHPDNIPPTPVESSPSITEQDSRLEEFSIKFDINAEDIMDFRADEGATRGREVVMWEASASAGPSELRFRPVQHFYMLPCHTCSRGNELNDYRNGVYNIRLFLHAQNGVFHHLVFFMEHTQDRTDTAYEAFYLGFEGQDLASINRSLAQYGLQINVDGVITLLNNNSLLDIYQIIYESLGNYQPGGANAINHPQTIQQSQEDPSSSNVNDMTELDSDGEESGSEIETEGEDDNDNDSAIIDEDSGLPWMEGPGESSNRGSIINARLVAAMNTRLEDGVPPQPMQNVVEQKKKLLNLTIYDLAAHFHLQAARAARRLNICQTSLKKQNKRLDVRRWPHRKVKAIDLRIRNVTMQMQQQQQQRTDQGKNGEGMRRLQAVLDSMRDKREALFRDYPLDPLAPVRLESARNKPKRNKILTINIVCSKDFVCDP